MASLTSRDIAAFDALLANRHREGIIVPR